MYTGSTSTDRFTVNKYLLLEFEGPDVVGPTGTAFPLVRLADGVLHSIVSLEMLKSS